MTTPDILQTNQVSVQVQAERKPWHPPELRKNSVSQNTASVAFTPEGRINCNPTSE